MKKKLISILLVVCMALTLLPATALAEELEAPAETIQQEESEMPSTEAGQGPIEQEPIEQVPSNQEPPAAPPQEEPPVEVPVQEPQGAMRPVPASAPAAPIASYVAEVGDQQYETLAAAIAAADGKTVTLLQNVNEDVVIPEGKTMTLDLSSFTLNNVGTGNTTHTVMVQSGANLTVRGNGKITSAVHALGVNGGTLILESGTVEAEKIGIDAWGAAAVQMKGGSISAGWGIEAFGPKSEDSKTTVAVSGGEITGKTAAMLLHANQSGGSAHSNAYPVEVTVSGSAKLSVGAQGESAIGVFGKGAVLNVTGGEITGGAGYGAICGNGTKTDKEDNSGTEINIKGGKIVGQSDNTWTGNGIYHPQDGVLNITGGEITGGTGIEIRAGKLNISGGIITGTATPTTVNPNGNGSTSDGVGVAVAQHTTKLPIEVTISGGTISGYSAFYESDPQNNKPGDAVKLHIEGGSFKAISNGTVSVYSKSYTGFISGGTFTHDPTAYLANDLKAVLENGSYTVRSALVAQAGENSYTTVAAAVAKANGGTVKLLQNVTENVTIPVGTTVTLDLNDHVLSGGTDAGKPALTNNGTVVIRDSGTGGEIRRDDHNVAGYYVIDNQGTMTIESGKVYNNTGTAPKGSSLIRNGGKSAGTVNKLIITGGEIRQDGFIAVKNDDYGTLEITGGTITATGSNQENTISAVQNWAQATITGGTFHGAIWTSVWSKDLDSSKTVIDGANVVVDGPIVTRPEPGYDCGEKTPNLEIKNGKFDAVWFVTDVSYVTVSGGFFTIDPGAYAATGMVSTASGNAAYPYTVVAKTAETVPVKPVKGEPDVPTADQLPNTIPENQKAAVASAAASVTVPVDTAANAVIQGIDDAKAQSLKNQAVNSGLTVNIGDTVTIYVRTILSVAPTSYSPADGTLVLEITPKYELVASTAANAQGITDGNSKVVQAAAKLPVSGSVQISLPLPGGYTTQAGTGNVYVQHQKGGVTYVYDATVAQAGGSYTATFTNPHGFSAFTLTKAGPQAKIGGTSYATLQDAVNAVSNGQTITVLANASATVSGNMTFTVETGGHNVTLTAASGYDLSQSASGNTIICTVSTHHTSGGGGNSGGGGGSSSSSTYAVTVDKSSGGTITVSPKRASKGDTVTVTVKPDAGYELDELTVTDKDGDEVRVSGKNNKFTFTMPKSAVTVEASFQKIDEAKVSTVLAFTDVKPGDWCYDAVQYVYDNGLMAGTSAYTFTPGGATTRGMIVTILYRMEGQPSIAGESGAFADVPAGQYYTDAVAWAAKNGIVSGYTNGNFGPNDPITREQMAAILYRYTGSPASSGMVLSEFTDADQISGYATDAMRWAVGNGLIAGTGNQALSPKSGASRAQVATILMRFSEMAAK